MLIKMTVRNFKRLQEVEIELGNPVVFVGPNNSGKTSAMQALALWGVGIRRWFEKRGSDTKLERRPGVTINRRELHSIPHPSAKLLWHDLHVRESSRVDGKQQTNNVRVDIKVTGVSEGSPWSCGLEFDYANEESFYCRPLRLEEGKSPRRMKVPETASAVQIAFLPPMSGLAATETRLYKGAIDVRIGEGRTADVLRNLCLEVLERESSDWDGVVQQIRDSFGVELNEPTYVAERGEVSMTYRERGCEFDLSSSGRGLQQTLLILAYMRLNPGSVLLLDEPDAHLEILRQRQIYRLISEAASASQTQIIAASHSEVLLNDAAERDLVIAFIGRPHRLEGRTSQLRKALAEIGFDHYLRAEQTKFVLYLEGSSDLSILRAFARRLKKEEVLKVLDTPFVHFVGNRLASVEHHFYGLSEAVPDLKGIALFDRMDKPLTDTPSLRLMSWKKREIENYLCTKATLVEFAGSLSAETLPLFAAPQSEQCRAAMSKAIGQVETALETLGGPSPWGDEIKASDEVLKPIFKNYFSLSGMPGAMTKRSFHELVNHMPEDEIDPEVTEKLDAIAEMANRASPAKVK